MNSTAGKGCPNNNLARCDSELFWGQAIVKCFLMTGKTGSQTDLYQHMRLQLAALQAKSPSLDMRHPKCCAAKD